MNNIIKRVWNQNRLVNIEDLTGMVFQAEADGHTFEISGIDDTGAAVELSGTVAGVFRRPDNADVPLTGSASGGIVSVTLSEDCYAVPGRFGLTIFVTSNSQKVAVYACVGTVAVSSTGNVAGDTPASVEDLIDDINAAIADLNSAIGQIPASYANVMAAIAPAYSSSALYAVGSYSWHDGTLYRCTTPITTAETWTAAHWTAAVLGDDVGELKSAFNNSDLALIGRENLLNDISWIDNKYIKGDGTVGDNVSYHMTDKIYLVAGTEYSMLFMSNAGYYRVCAYNSNDGVNSLLVNGSSQSADKRTINFTIPENTSYIRASFQKPGTAYGIIEGKSVDEMFSDTDAEIEHIKRNIADIESAVSVTWQKGLISASNGAIASSANGATSNIIEGATYVKLSETCKAVVGFYDAGTYIGKLNASGGVDKVGGSWGYITGLSDLSEIMQSCNADGITIGIVPTDSTVITTDNVQTYGDGHCTISTKNTDYDIAELSEHVSRLENVTYNQSKGAYCIMQYNVGNWYNGTGYLVPEEKYNKFYTLQKNIIERYMPDVMCMQEYRSQFTASTKASDFLHEFYRNIVSARDTTSYDGKGIASNRNMHGVSNVAFTDTETGGVVRNYEKCYVYLNGRKVLLVSAHLGSSGVISSNINDLLSLVANEEYFIICADMNINGNNPLIAQFTEAGYHIANTGDIITYPSDPNYLAIDNIITSANIEIKSSFADTQKAGLEEGTDHYPLVAYVDIV